MKTITFEGKQYEVEDWVNYIARDHDGEIYGYEAEPIILDRTWWDNVGDTKFKLIDLFSAKWQDSLTKV